MSKHSARLTPASRNNRRATLDLKHAAYDTHIEYLTNENGQVAIGLDGRPAVIEIRTKRTQ